jgi:hypothetical protein
MGRGSPRGCSLLNLPEELGKGKGDIVRARVPLLPGYQVIKERTAYWRGILTRIGGIDDPSGLRVERSIIR